MAYLLDTNVFIEAKNLYYGLDFCPAFWDWLTLNNVNLKVFSIEKVGDEIDEGRDELAQWANQRGSDFFSGHVFDFHEILTKHYNFVVYSYCLFFGESNRRYHDLFLKYNIGYYLSLLSPCIFTFETRGDIQ